MNKLLGPACWHAQDLHKSTQISKDKRQLNWGWEIGNSYTYACSVFYSSCSQNSEGTRRFMLVISWSGPTVLKFTIANLIESVLHIKPLREYIPGLQSFRNFQHKTVLFCSLIVHCKYLFFMLTLYYSSKINGYLYHQRVYPPLKTTTWYVIRGQCCPSSRVWQPWIQLGQESPLMNKKGLKSIKSLTCRVPPPSKPVRQGRGHARDRQETSESRSNRGPSPANSSTSGYSSPSAGLQSKV